MRAAGLVAIVFLASLFASDAVAGPCSGSNICFWYPNSEVISTQVVYFIEWGWFGSDPQNEAAAITNVLYALPGTRYEHVITQYYGTVDHFPGPVYYAADIPFYQASHFWADNTNPLPPGGAYPDTNQLSNEAIAAAIHFGIYNTPAAKQAIFLIAMPSGRQWLDENTDCAGHAWSSPTGTPGYPPMAFIGLPYQPDETVHCFNDYPDPTSAVLQHEIAETITDPLLTFTDTDGPGTAWANNNVDEVGDVCEATPMTSTEVTPVQLQVNDPANPHVAEFGIVPIWNRLAFQGTGSCSTSYAAHTDSFYTGTDGGIWHQTGNSLYANEWGKPGGQSVTASPGVVSWGPNRLDVFAPVADGSIGHFYSSDGGTTIGSDNWGFIPSANGIGRVAVASWGAQQLDLFAQALPFGGTKKHLYHYQWQGSGWQDLGAPAPASMSDPAAVSWGQTEVSTRWYPYVALSNRYDVFVTGSDNHLYQVWSTDGGATFSAWQDWGAYPSGTMNGQPTVTAWANARLDIFVPTTSGNLAHRYWIPGSSNWDTWTAPAGSSGQGVGVVGLGDERLFLTIPTTDGKIWQSTWDWGISSPWTVTGGSATSSRSVGVSSW